MAIYRKSKFHEKICSTRSVKLYFTRVYDGLRNQGARVSRRRRPRVNKWAVAFLAILVISLILSFFPKVLGVFDEVPLLVKADYDTSLSAKNVTLRVSAKNVTVGVSGLREIINVAQEIKTPSISAYLKMEAIKSKKRAKKCSVWLNTPRDITEATGAWYDPNPMKTIIEEVVEFLWSYQEMPDEEMVPVKISPWLELNREMMVDNNLSIADVAEKIKCEFQDESADDDIFLKKIATEINKVIIKSGKVNKFDEKEGFTAESEWILDTEGVSLLAVMDHEDVDPHRTTSNHVIEVFEVFGIEAARRCLLDELCAVISFDGSYVYYRYLATMTYRGHLMAITRHGINSNYTGLMMRCSFEETVDILRAVAEDLGA